MATMALRDWLVVTSTRQTRHGARRSSRCDEPELDTDEIVEALKEFGEQSPEHLLGELLNYWRRERSANVTPKFAEAASDFASLYGDRDFIANLQFLGFEEVTGRSGEPVKNAVFTWPEQTVDSAFRTKNERAVHRGRRRARLRVLAQIDFESVKLRMRWSESSEESGGMPLGDHPRRLHLAPREARRPVPPRRADPASRSGRSGRAGSRWRCSRASVHDSSRATGRRRPVH